MAKRTHSGEDLFLAGRRLGWVPIGFSLFASNISSTTLIGLSGAAYTWGIAVSNYEWMALFKVWLQLQYGRFPGKNSLTRRRVSQAQTNRLHSETTAG